MHVIAFINRPFASNPAVVCLLDTNRRPDQASIQHAAARHPCIGSSRAPALPITPPATHPQHVVRCPSATYVFDRDVHNDGGLLRSPPAGESCHQPVCLRGHGGVASPDAHAVRDEQQRWDVHHRDALPFQRLKVRSGARIDLSSVAAGGIGHRRVGGDNLRRGSRRDGRTLGGTTKGRDPGHRSQPDDDKRRYHPHDYYRWGVTWLAVPARANCPWCFHGVHRKAGVEPTLWPGILVQRLFPWPSSSVLGLLPPETPSSPPSRRR